MAIKTRAQLEAASLDKLPDNETKLIQPIDHRSVNTDLIDSMYNKAEDSVLTEVHNGDGLAGNGSIGTPLSYDFASLPVATTSTGGQMIILDGATYKRIDPAVIAPTLTSSDGVKGDGVNTDFSLDIDGLTETTIKQGKIALVDSGVNKKINLSELATESNAVLRWRNTDNTATSSTHTFSQSNVNEVLTLVGDRNNDPDTGQDWQFNIENGKGSIDLVNNMIDVQNLSINAIIDPRISCTDNVGAGNQQIRLGMRLIFNKTAYIASLPTPTPGTFVDITSDRMTTPDGTPTSVNSKGYHKGIESVQITAQGQASEAIIFDGVLFVVTDVSQVGGIYNDAYTGIGLSGKGTSTDALQIDIDSLAETTDDGYVMVKTAAGLRKRLTTTLGGGASASPVFCYPGGNMRDVNTNMQAQEDLAIFHYAKLTAGTYERVTLDINQNQITAGQRTVRVFVIQHDGTFIDGIAVNISSTSGTGIVSFTLGTGNKLVIPSTGVYRLGIVINSSTSSQILELKGSNDNPNDNYYAASVSNIPGFVAGENWAGKTYNTYSQFPVIILDTP